ncbi:MAG: winged helix-turn-helix domain-containing protein [Pseudomonadota bacterium]
MKEGPDIARIGALIGDPARANILTALMSGKALTATELAGEAGVTLQTASAHLKKLESASLLRQRKQGRHRYFAIADDDVGNVLESIMGLAAKRGMLRTRTGPADAELKKARVCYDHLAGDLGVLLYDRLLTNNLLLEDGDEVVLSSRGALFVANFGVDLGRLQKSRRPLCKACLDWSARRSHLAGALGAALLDALYARKWATRKPGSRIVAFTRSGEKQFIDWLDSESFDQVVPR